MSPAPDPLGMLRAVPQASEFQRMIDDSQLLKGLRVRGWLHAPLLTQGVYAVLPEFVPQLSASERAALLARNAVVYVPFPTLASALEAHDVAVPLDAR